MTSKAATVQDYLDQAPEKWKPVLAALRAAIKKNLPEGFQETMDYGMIGYVVPHSRYPAGYHVDPSHPLPFMALAAQKQHVSLYHMGLYADPALLSWFTAEYRLASAAALDMGKSCIRFRRDEEVPYALVGELVRKISVEKWIEGYEKSLQRRTS